MKKHIAFILLLVAFANFSYSQTKGRFDENIETIKKYDKIYPLPADPILFTGSSSIRGWRTLQLAFGKYNVLNRGIGGAVVNDISYYLDDIVFPYHPRQIILYVGENDLPQENVTADTVLNRTVHLYRQIRAKLPDVPIVYISIKPSPVRDRYQQKAKETNQLIKDFLSKEKNAVFLDIFSLMIENGKSRPELFIKDMLHMNEEGYRIWEKALAPYLLKRD